MLKRLFGRNKTKSAVDNREEQLLTQSLHTYYEQHCIQSVVKQNPLVLKAIRKGVKELYKSDSTTGGSATNALKIFKRNSSHTVLSFRKMNLGDEQVITICKILEMESVPVKTNTSFNVIQLSWTKIILKGCQLSDNVLPAIGRALQLNVSVEVLDLSRNNITAKGAEELYLFVSKRRKPLKINFENNKMERSEVLKYISKFQRISLPEHRKPDFDTSYSFLRDDRTNSDSYGFTPNGDDAVKPQRFAEKHEEDNMVAENVVSDTESNLVATPKNKKHTNAEPETKPDRYDLVATPTSSEDEDEYDEESEYSKPQTVTESPTVKLARKIVPKLNFRHISGLPASSGSTPITGKALSNKKIESDLSHEILMVDEPEEEEHVDVQEEPDFDFGLDSGKHSIESIESITSEHVSDLHEVPELIIDEPSDHSLIQVDEYGEISAIVEMKTPPVKSTPRRVKPMSSEKKKKILGDLDHKKQLYREVYTVDRPSHYDYIGDQYLNDLSVSYEALVSIDISYCRLDGLPELPATLKYLNISFNRIDNLGDSLVECKDLVNLVSRFNYLKDCKGIIQQVRLEQLDLAGNLITDIFDLGHLSNLEVLDISFNKIQHKESLRSLSLNKKLKSISLQGNPLTFNDKLSERMRIHLLHLAPQIELYNKLKITLYRRQRKGTPMPDKVKKTRVTNKVSKVSEHLYAPKKIVSEDIFNEIKKQNLSIEEKTKAAERQRSLIERLALPKIPSSPAVEEPVVPKKKKKSRRSKRERAIIEFIQKGEVRVNPDRSKSINSSIEDIDDDVVKSTYNAFKDDFYATRIALITLKQYAQNDTELYVIMNFKDLLQNCDILEFCTAPHAGILSQYPSIEKLMEKTNKMKRKLRSMLSTYEQSYSEYLTTQEEGLPTPKSPHPRFDNISIPSSSRPASPITDRDHYSDAVIEDE